jgi:hypothetical protein
MAKRKSNKKRPSRRRILRGGDDTAVAPAVAAPVDAAVTAPVDSAAAVPPATEGSFMGSLFSTESKPEAPVVADEVKPAAEAAVVMASTYKAKKGTAKNSDSKSDSKAKKGKKGKCKTAKGNCKKWFKLNKNKLCTNASASVSPSM